MTGKRASRTTLPAFTPVPRARMRRHGWSAARQREFIEALADLGSVRAACRQMGVGEYGIYALRRHPQAASFRAAWEAALDIGIRRIEDVAMDRALHGVEQPVYHAGEIVGTRRVYNDRLMMFMLRNRAPKRFAADGAGRSGGGMNAIDQMMLIRSAAINASCGMLTLPYSRILALPFFCLSRSFFLRLISPP